MMVNFLFINQTFLKGFWKTAEKELLTFLQQVLGENEQMFEGNSWSLWN